ncbi:MULTISPECIES: hypothetical protein [Vibrio]|uniref:hypothetical protein n=1 Tax=Vibrio TaxID=662 RepID=UPI00207658BD|nr:MULTISPECIES: hypothetical protein [Vibrio]USD31636.1 hypothetical protein J8Z27_10150 [Vibrio sp. SCSIO 43186]USD44679.1 hypothetical protein J4N38_10535 [Vibrio sp. SCSIO 43145]USD68759.1 hypothetical protein J4N41_10150 [Vibrio sp. SCSIO 43139]USD96449.1 hypothetical protein CTT30_10275 [Vibrio coralliilyticus]
MNTHQGLESKSLQTKIKTPNVAYEQHSTLIVDSEAPDIIVHELDWDDYKREDIQTVMTNVLTLSRSFHSSGQ